MNGIPMYIRQLHEMDIKNSFYDLMALSSKENIQIINTYTETELHYKLSNDHKIFVIINLNTTTVIGTGTIKISNNNSKCVICIIQDIKIHEDFINNNNKTEDTLYNIFLQSLIDYCREEKQCSKCIVKIDDNSSDEHILHPL